MAVPKKRQTSSHKGQRRSHHGLKRMVLVNCQQCKKPIPGHTACPFCGTYKGREVIDVVSKFSKKEKKKKAASEAGHTHDHK
jgi:large subunit ribosomal protein L32